LFDNLPTLKPPAAAELRDELERYLSTDPEHVTDSISWWCERKMMFPHLHCMALDYLTIPGVSRIPSESTCTIYSISFVATSVDVKRAFSQGRLLLSHVRSRLSVQSTQALMCLGAWSLRGFVKDSDVQAVTILPGVAPNTTEAELEADWDAIGEL